jgi:DnaA family protein
MEMGDEVVNFLMQRTARDFHTLFALLDRLDRETLIAQRKITIPFVKQLFDL